MTDQPPVSPLFPPAAVSFARYALTAGVSWWMATHGFDGITIANAAAAFMQLLVTVSWALERWHPGCNLRTWGLGVLVWVRERLT